MGDLKVISDAPESSVLFLAHVLRVLAYCKADVVQPLWEMMMEPEWQKGCFSRLSLDALQPVFDAYTELARRVPDERAIELPHVFANSCDLDELDPERRRWFFSFAVLAAANVGRVSAIRRLLKGSRCVEFTPEVDCWRSALRESISSSPPTLAGVLRDLLSSFRIGV